MNIPKTDIQAFKEALEEIFNTAQAIKNAPELNSVRVMAMAQEIQNKSYSIKALLP